MAVICLLVVIIEGVFKFILFYDKNPVSTSPLGVNNNLYQLGRLVLKLVPPIYFIIDVDRTYQNIYIIVQAALVLAYLFFFRMFSIHHYNQNSFYF